MRLASRSKLTVYSREPLNAEPSPAGLLENFVTPKEALFIRNHGDVPQVNPADYTLQVEGLVERPLQLSLPELRSRFPVAETMATLQCAGNRRDQLQALASMPAEIPWTSQAVGNAWWRGASLAAVLRAAQVQASAEHVCFLGLDEIPGIGGFGGSIPLAKAMQQDVLLAFEMNGALLDAQHGFPLRVIVPGYIAARSVKWLSRITIQRAPSSNEFQQNSYRLFPPHVSAEAADWSAGEMLGELRLNSAILYPEEGARVPAGKLIARGYAIPAGSAIERIEISLDDGGWQPAQIVQPEALRRSAGIWQFWQAEIDLSCGLHKIAVRARDAAGMQPEHPAETWNFKGYMNNAWHWVRITAH